MQPLDRCEVCGGLLSGGSALAAEYDVAVCDCEPEDWQVTYREMYEGEDEDD